MANSTKINVYSVLNMKLSQLRIKRQIGLKLRIKVVSNGDGALKKILFSCMDMVKCQKKIIQGVSSITSKDRSKQLTISILLMIK